MQTTVIKMWIRLQKPATSQVCVSMIYQIEFTIFIQFTLFEAFKWKYCRAIDRDSIVYDCVTVCTIVIHFKAIYQEMQILLKLFFMGSFIQTITWIFLPSRIQLVITYLPHVFGPTKLLALNVLFTSDFFKVQKASIELNTK